MRSLARPFCHLALGLAGVALASPAARAQTALAGETEIARDGPVVVFAENGELASDKAKKLIERIRAAYDWVKGEQHWANTDVLGHDLAVHVLTDEHMKEKHKGAVGVAVGKHSFLIGESFLERDASERTLAHELTHLQDHRHLIQKGTKLPHYLTEGRAIAMGIGWCQKLGVSPAKYETGLAKILGRMPVESARKVLRDDPEKPEKLMEPALKRDMEALGYLFVEFLRTRLGGQGLADVEARLARVIEAVGAGTKLEDAFEKEIGTKLAAAQDQLLAHMEATEGKPAERLRGTALEAFAVVKAPSPAAKPSEPDDP